MKRSILFLIFIAPYLTSAQDEPAYHDDNGILYLRGTCFTGRTQDFCDRSGAPCPKDDYNKTFLVLNTFTTNTDRKKYKYAVYTQDSQSKRWYRVTRITQQTIKRYGCITAIYKVGDEVVVEHGTLVQRFKKSAIKEPFLAEWALVQ